MPAALSMRESYHSIHVGRKRLALEAGGNQLGGVRRAIASRHHRNIVARAYPAIFASEAEELRNVPAGTRRLNVAGRIFVGKRLFFECHIVRMYMAAGIDALPCAAYHLAVTNNCLAGRDGLERQLVP